MLSTTYQSNKARSINNSWSVNNTKRLPSQLRLFKRETRQTGIPKWIKEAICLLGITKSMALVSILPNAVTYADAAPREHHIQATALPIRNCDSCDSPFSVMFKPHKRQCPSVPASNTPQLNTAAHHITTKYTSNS